MGKRVLIVAGEASGDAHGALLVRSMRERDGDVEFYGVGGQAMREAGVHIVLEASELSIMGFSEAGHGLARAVRAYRQLKRGLRGADAPDLVILIDFPEFNLVLAGAARRAGRPVFYYVSPQVWAWRRGRIRKIAERVTRMVVLFPFEKQLYDGYGMDVHFVGHPLAEDVVATRGRPQTRALHKLPTDSPVVALLPGSRTKEVEANLPAMIGAARLMREQARFVVARAPGLPAALFEEVCAAGDVAVVGGDTYNLVAASDAVAVTSGTATVECALMGVPMVVVYRMSRSTYLLARALVHAPRIAMPNIILGREAVPELIQDEVNEGNLALELRRLLEPETSERMRADFAEIRRQIVLPGAASRAAELALELLA